MTEVLETHGLEDGKRLYETEKYFLEGQRKHHQDVRILFKVFYETGHALWKFRNLGPSVTMFGSARFKEDNPYYQLAQETAKEISQVGINIITGGGPGIMEAANRGCQEGVATSVGCNIDLPFEQGMNPYIDKHFDFHYFFIRKMIMVKYSYAFVLLPGGFGTLDEIFETLTLIQTRKIKNFPVIVMGKDFWNEMTDFINKSLIEKGTISPNDIKLWKATDDPEEALQIIADTMVDKFGFNWKKKKLFKFKPKIKKAS